MTEYVVVQLDVGDEGGDKKEKAHTVELPTEENKTLLLTVLQSQYEGATGLKYRFAFRYLFGLCFLCCANYVFLRVWSLSRNPTTGSWRGVRISDGVLHPPAEGWGHGPYVVVTPKKADV